LSPAATIPSSRRRGPPSRYAARCWSPAHSPAKQRHPRTGAPGRAPRLQTAGPPAPALVARQASRSPEPPAQSSPHPPFPPQPRRDPPGWQTDTGWTPDSAPHVKAEPLRSGERRAVEKPIMAITGPISRPSF
jgi:hypothetical protein